MSARPGDWHLVGRDSDPAPGDPIVVGEEAQHYSTVARQIEGQVRRLNQLAQDDAALKGHYAVELQGACKDLADDLDKMHDRFEMTGSQLAVLQPALETARTKTKAALDAAVDDKADEEKKVANDPQYDTEPQSPFAKSQPEMDCDSAMSYFDGVADDVARKIKAAADDDMKDSGWDKFKGAVGKISGVLKWVTKIIGFIVLAITVLALFIPGLNVLVVLLVLAVLLAISLSINTLLAVTDNGSWLDVGLDVVGLLTLGIGTKAIAVAKAGRAITLTRAARPAARIARTQAFQRTAWNGGRGVRGLVSRFRPSVISARSRAYADEFAHVVNRPLPGISVREAITAPGSRDVATMLKDLRAIRGEFPGVNVAIRHAGGVRAAQGASGVDWVASGTSNTRSVIEIVDMFSDGTVTTTTGDTW